MRIIGSASRKENSKPTQEYLTKKFILIDDLRDKEALLLPSIKDSNHIGFKTHKQKTKSVINLFKVKNPCK